MLHLFVPPSPQLLGTTELSTVSIRLPFLECHVVGVIQYVAFSDVTLHHPLSALL